MEPATELQLRDIQLPPAPPWWPPAPGWWLAGVLLLALAGVLLRRWARWRRVRRRRGRWLQMLATLDRELADAPLPEYLAGVSALLKRIALQCYPRTDVAALYGEDWLAFLDRSGGDGGFVTGPGRLLADANYRPQAPPDADIDGLRRLVRRWLLRNLEVRA